MISFRRMTRIEWLLLRLSKKRREAYDARLRETMGELVANPDMPCEIESVIVRPTRPPGRGV